MNLIKYQQMFKVTSLNLITLSVREKNIILMQTGWSKASRRVPRDPTCLLLKTDAGYQTIWIEDQAQRFVGPGLRTILFVKGI